MARRAIGHGQKGAPDADGLRAFLAERLVALAAGAVFIVAPAGILLSGSGLPGTYGAAAAVALTFVAIPFLALGWLTMSGAPWMAGIFAIACWSALAGALAAVSPLLALISGLVLFKVAGEGRIAERVRTLLASVEPAVTADAAETDARNETTRLELSSDGAIADVAGYRKAVFRTHRMFIDHVHLADRIAFLGAFSDITKQRRETAEVSVRLNFADQGQAQSFDTVRIGMARMSAGIALTLHERVEAPAVRAVTADTAGQKRFLATVSHELRTPLNSIIGFSDILRRDLFGELANDRQREYVDLIYSSGTHLLSVVNTILDVSKIDAGTYGIHREQFDLNAMAGECVSMLRPQADAKGLTLQLATEPAIGAVDGDRRALKQVLINLLSNAVKFTEQGGEVRLAIKRRENGYAIRVSDTGIGMTNDELAGIGTPFMQADNSYTRNCEGTGLGLTVVKGLVQLHGGSLDVESEPGAGTRVTIFIPDNAAVDDGGQNAQGAAEDLSAVRPEKGQDGDKPRVHANAVRLAG
jgi:cell cycle sensor histidine kinase DivJ